MNPYLVEVLSLLVALTAVSLLFVRDLLHMALLLGVYSGLAAVLLALMGAVDVAFTEAVVGAGVSTVVFMALVWRVQSRRIEEPGRKRKIQGALAALAFGVVLLLCVNALPAFGAPDAPPHVHLAPEYIACSMGDTETPNVVTAVLAAYRGFDTLIETSVVLTAALACVLIMGRKL